MKRQGFFLTLAVTVTVSIFSASFRSLLPSHWDYYVAVAGRFVFGLGGESLSVVQSTYCAKVSGLRMLLPGLCCLIYFS